MTSSSARRWASRSALAVLASLAAALSAQAVTGVADAATSPASSSSASAIQNTIWVTGQAAKTKSVGQSVSLQMAAKDSDPSQTLTYHATGLPPGLSISSSTGLISGRLTTAGGYMTTVTVTDTTGASGSTTFGWSVVVSVTVTNPGPQSTDAVYVGCYDACGLPYMLQIHATDAVAGQTLTYSATGLPLGLGIDSSTGLISGSPTNTGTYTVTVTATDGAGRTGSATFPLTVDPPAGGGGGMG